MVESTFVTLLCQDKAKINCDKQLLQFSEKLCFLPSLDCEIPCDLVEAEVFKQIEKFYELYEYNQLEIKNENEQILIESDDLQKQLSERQKQFIMNYLNNGELEISKLKALLEAANIYQFQILEDFLLKCIAIKFYCPNGQETIEKYEEKWNIPVLDELTIKGIQNEYSNIFDLHQQFITNFIEEECKELNEENSIQQN